MSGAERSVGPQLRVKRREHGMSLRELARRLDISASLVSQIETGKSQPSVRTLYAIATELGASLDEMLERDEPPAYNRAAHGERWRQIVTWGEDGVEFAMARYVAGTTTNAPNRGMRRFGLLLVGVVTVAVGADEHRLGEGDSISLNGGTSAEVRNDGALEARAIWVLDGGAPS